MIKFVKFQCSFYYFFQTVYLYLPHMEFTPSTFASLGVGSANVIKIEHQILNVSTLESFFTLVSLHDWYRVK